MILVYLWLPNTTIKEHHETSNILKFRRGGGGAPRLPYKKGRSSFFSMIAAPGGQHPSLGACLINGVISCSKNLNGTLTCTCTCPHQKSYKICSASHQSCTICSCFFLFLYFSSRWPQTAGWLLGTTVTLFTRFYQTRFEDCTHFQHRIDHLMERDQQGFL